MSRPASLVLAFAAALLLAEPLLAAPSGSIVADTAAVVLPSGGPGSVGLRWQTQQTSTAEVWVQVDDGVEVLMARQRRGTVTVPWIHLGRRYTFTLYGDGARQQVLGRQVVFGIAAGGGEIAAEPADVALAAGRGSTTLHWASDVGAAEVWVSRDGAAETLFARGGAGSQAVPWIRASSYAFRLYAPGRARALDTVVVRGLSGAPTPTPTPTPTPAANAADRLQSSYASLTRDTLVSSAPTTVVTTDVELRAEQWVFFQSDGRVFPAGSRAAATLQIHVDGRPVGTRAVMDWRGSRTPVQHGINAVAAERLPAGRHTISVVAQAQAGRFNVGAGTNLSVLVRPAEQIQSTQLNQDSQRYAFVTGGVGFEKAGYGARLPHTPMLTHTVRPNRGEPLIALGAGTVYEDGGEGDAMWGLFLNGRYDFLDPRVRTNMSVTDIWDGAALRAPLFVQGFFDGGQFDGSPQRVSLDAAEFPWGSLSNGTTREPRLRFRSTRGSNLITLHGGLTVAGAVDVLPQFLRGDYIVLGGSRTPAAPLNTPRLLAEGVVDIPQDHDGVVFFTAKARVQGDSADQGGNAFLWLEIDGARRGFTGTQQLRYPASVSQRTVGVSYLAAGSQRLSAGQHRVRLFGQANGQFKHLSVHNDCAVVYFD